MRLCTYAFMCACVCACVRACLLFVWASAGVQPCMHTRQHRCEHTCARARVCIHLSVQAKAMVRELIHRASTAPHVVSGEVHRAGTVPITPLIRASVCWGSVLPPSVAETNANLQARLSDFSAFMCALFQMQSMHSIITRRRRARSTSLLHQLWPAWSRRSLKR